MGNQRVRPIEENVQKMPTDFDEDAQEMSTEFDKVMDEIQNTIIEEARKVYSEKVIELWLNPRLMGEINNPQGSAEVTGTCGDTIQISLKINHDKVADARFITDGCASSIAAAGMACELVIGRDVEEVFDISKEVILKELGGLPEESIHCALLASDSLKAALTDYFKANKEPWKGPYKKD